ncbi:hypothetical protein J6590_108414 [Homalodisca vitripennis]|nr:hypothetical protein J6590_108414 [Homalodisca vitripennis]
MCDASEIGLGSTLLQEFNGDSLPIAYYSKKFTDAEKCMSVYEKEALSVILSMEKFHSYLEIQPFLLITDNSALSWVLGHFRKLGRLGRWVERILSLPFRLQHVKGSDNKVADCLSRMHEIVLDEANNKNKISTDNSNKKNKQYKKHRCVNKKVVKDDKIDVIQLNVIKDFPLAFTKIVQHQKNDVEIQDIVKSIERKENSDKFYLNKGVLMFRISDRNKGKIYLPKILIEMIFNYYHSSVLGGHPGIKRTIAKVTEHFYRPNLVNEIKNKIKNCALCKMSKPAQRIYEGQLIATHAKQALERIYIDIFGSLVRTKDGYNNILIVDDDMTRYCWLIPLRNCKSISVIRKLEEIVFNNFSTCQVLVSDNGSCFKSEEFKQFCFKYGIEHHKLVPYKPSGNRSERYLRNLKSMLQAFYHDKQDMWNKDLNYLQMSLNTALNESINSTPFKLMFNHSPNHALSNLWRINDLIDNKVTPQEISIKIKNAIKNVKKSVEHNRGRVRYSEEKVKHPFKLGSKVFLKTHFLSNKANKFQNKLGLRYTGIYSVIYFLNPVVVLIQKIGEPHIVKRAHISQLKPA